MSRRMTSRKSETPPYVQITTFYLLVIITLTQMSHVASARSWVKIWNNIGPGQRLWVACYYELLNRGYKKPVTIHFGEVYYFRFEQVRLVKTRWWCNFQWENTYRNQTVTVWDHTKGHYMPVDCSQCLWAARPEGWYVWDKDHNKFKFAKPWMKPMLPPPHALSDHADNSSQMFGFSQKQHNDSRNPAVVLSLGI